MMINIQILDGGLGTDNKNSDIVCRDMKGNLVAPDVSEIKRTVYSLKKKQVEDVD